MNIGFLQWGAVGDFAAYDSDTGAWRVNGHWAAPIATSHRGVFDGNIFARLFWWCLPGTDLIMHLLIDRYSIIYSRSFHVPTFKSFKGHRFLWELAAAWHAHNKNGALGFVGITSGIPSSNQRVVLQFRLRCPWVPRSMNSYVASNSGFLLGSFNEATWHTAIQVHVARRSYFYKLIFL